MVMMDLQIKQTNIFLKKGQIEKFVKESAEINFIHADLNINF